MRAIRQSEGEKKGNIDNLLNFFENLFTFDLSNLVHLIKSDKKRCAKNQCKPVVVTFHFLGVYPKTSSSEDNNFTTRCDYLDKMIEERIKTYKEEEKALRVIIMEEEEQREIKEKQQRLEQKALLNLSKG